MKNYKYFLLERKSVYDGIDYRKELTESEFDEMLKINCKDFSWEDKPIYRGLHDETTFLFLNPTTIDRRSANTNNYYTYLFDNSPYRDNFPKRSKSLICSSNYSTAYGYSSRRPHRIIPFDGAKIASVNRSDFWNGFIKLSRFGDLEDFNKSLKRVFYRIFGSEIRDDNYDNFITDLQKLCDIYSEFPTGTITNGYDIILPTIDDYFKLFDPLENGLVLYDYNTYKLLVNKLLDNELWTDSKCLLIQTSSDGHKEQFYQYHQ
jgi:hypothetical protein